MTNYTPMTDEMRGQYMNAALTEDGPPELRTRAVVGAEFDAWLQAHDAQLLATVRPNPDDARQRKIASQAVYGQLPRLVGASDPHALADLADRIARAVLAALAAMGGERS